MARGRPIIGGWKELGYTEKEWKSFSKHKRWRARNPEKARAASASWISRNQDKRSSYMREWQLQNSYGIGVEQYDSILAEQGGMCAICSTDKPTGKWKVFAVDHDHDTGQVRGLLCNECNRGMGLLKDNASLLRLAAEYLDRHKAKTKESRVK